MVIFSTTINEKINLGHIKSMMICMMNENKKCTFLSNFGLFSGSKPKQTCQWKDTSWTGISIPRGTVSPRVSKSTWTKVGNLFSLTKKTVLCVVSQSTQTKVGHLNSIPKRKI